MIRNKLSSGHIDRLTLNCYIDAELHVGEEERIWRHAKYCCHCALYVVSSIELKAAVAPAGLRLAPRAVGTAKANPARKGNLVYNDSQQAHRAAANQLEPILRQPVLLCDLEELSYRDIALILHPPVSTVMSSISDARDTLCQLLILQDRKSQ